LFPVPTRFVFSRFALALAACLAVAATARGEFAYVVSFSTGELIRFAIDNPAATRTTLVPGGEIEGPPGPLEGASGMAFGPDGNLYIGLPALFGGSPSIARYNVATGLLSTLYTFPDSSARPASLAFRGNDLLVGRNPFGGSVGPVVQLANAIGGPITQSDFTSGTTLASTPGLAFAADGTLYVSDMTYSFFSEDASGPVKRFAANGNYLGVAIADGAAGLDGPTGLAILGSTLYTASVMNASILRTDTDTGITQTFFSTSDEFSPGPLALLAAGGLLAGDTGGSGPAEIYRLDGNGQLLQSYNLDLGQVGGIAISAVPEPGTFFLVAIGLGAGAALVRCRREGR
jgi:sugar lactone lactonase YvrE